MTLAAALSLARTIETVTVQERVMTGSTSDGSFSSSTTSEEGTYQVYSKFATSARNRPQTQRTEVPATDVGEQAI